MKIYDSLLKYIANTLFNEGFEYLGVDCGAKTIKILADMRGDNMRNKQIALLLAIALLLLCGCGKAKENEPKPQTSVASIEKDNSQTTGGQATTDEKNVKEYDHNLVCDLWSDSGSFKMYISEEEFFTLYFDYSVPQIVDDTEDAKELNYYITCLFGSMHDTMQRASKEGTITVEEFDETDCFQVNYDCYWNGSIASIVIYSTGYFDSPTRYNVYNYDFATGKQVSNEEIFALKGITGEEFVDGLQRAAVYSLDMEMQMFFEYEMPLVKDELWYVDLIDESVQHMYADYLLARARTIYNENIDEQVQIYLDENGELKAVTRIYNNMDMYGEATVMLSPLAWVNNGLSASSGNLLDVVSKDDGIYLTIYKDEWSEDIRDEFPTFDFAKEHKINGLYKNYTEARISWVGNGKQPYILLLSDDGMISYVDVWEGIASGYFCAVEPLWGLENIVSFSDDSEYRIAAVDNEGRTIDVEDSLYMMLTCKYIDFEKNMLNLNNVTRYIATVNRKESGQDVEYEELIGFTDDKYHMFVRESYKTPDYEGGAQVGYITFNGMNENGMVFSFSLVGDEGELRGAMALNTYSFWDGDISDFIDRADATWLSGFDIFESHGDKVVLLGSVG